MRSRPAPPGTGRRRRTPCPGRPIGCPRQPRRRPARPPRFWPPATCRRLRRAVHDRTLAAPDPPTRDEAYRVGHVGRHRQARPTTSKCLIAQDRCETGGVMTTPAAKPAATSAIARSASVTCLRRPDVGRRVRGPLQRVAENNATKAPGPRTPVAHRGTADGCRSTARTRRAQ